MGSTSDFESMRDWHFREGADLMAYAEQGRLVIGTGAEVTQLTYHELLPQVELIVAKNWHHFEEGGFTLGPLSIGQQTPRSIARRALRPLEHTGDALLDLQRQIVKLKETYMRYVAVPIIEGESRQRGSAGRGFNPTGGL